MGGEGSCLNPIRKGVDPWREAVGVSVRMEYFARERRGFLSFRVRHNKRKKVLPRTRTGGQAEYSARKGTRGTLMPTVSD